MQRVSPEEGEEEIQGRHDMCVWGGGGGGVVCVIFCAWVYVYICLFIHKYWESG